MGGDGVARLMRPLLDAAEQLAAVPHGARRLLTIAQTTLLGANGQWVHLDTPSGKPGPSQANKLQENGFVRGNAGDGPVAFVNWNQVCYPTRVPPRQRCPAPARLLRTCHMLCRRAAARAAPRASPLARGLCVREQCGVA